MLTPVSEALAEEAIRDIGAAVGVALNARCVLLFGSRSRGDHMVHSDVDLAVVLGDPEVSLKPQERVDLETRGATVAEAAGGGLFRRVDVRVWTEPEYRSEKRSINHVAGRSWREGILLFGSHETLPGEEVVAELPHVRELIEMAQGQLVTIDILRNPAIREEDFGFHAERATELTLKAWIALTGNQYQLTHHLYQLFNQLEVAGVLETNKFRSLSSLSNYAVVCQYRRIESPEMDRERATEDVRELVTYVAFLLECAEAE